LTPAAGTRITNFYKQVYFNRIPPRPQREGNHGRNDKLSYQVCSRLI